MSKALLASLLIAVGCVHSQENSVSLNPTIVQDHDYNNIHDDNTRSANIITDFETRYTVTATYLSPEFRAALAKRYERLYREPQTVLEEATNKTGFFVSFFSPTNEGYDLTDGHSWTITMQLKEQKLKPVLVKKLSEKERWQPFFKGVHTWSKEYLVLFDTPSTSTSSTAMVEKNSINLEFANADAQVKLEW